MNTTAHLHDTDSPGVNVKALSSYLGHSSITITLDRYGHLMPGNETESIGLVDAYLERATPRRGSRRWGTNENGVAAPARKAAAL
jgi:hypothetical protein